MRVPQVSERIKELPAQALRGVFAGVGQLLLITDKLRNKAPASQQVPQVPPTRRPERPEAGAAAAAPAAKDPEARDLDKTGNVRLLGDAQTDGSGVAQAAEAIARAAEVPVAAEVLVAAEVPVAAEVLVAAELPVPEAKAPAADATEPPAGEPGPPLPNYDELSIASLRARLRNLDAGEVKQLAEYERAHAARADVIAMFERRIAKLEAGG